MSDVAAVEDEKFFTLGLDFDEACVLRDVLQEALPKLPEDDGWLMFQLLEALQARVDSEIGR
ncbi:MAG: hypothetical protein FJ351_06670 [Sphingomonadales bacterium]|nr:hypothetical protein [Sphingomonadales bacterium]